MYVRGETEIAFNAARVLFRFFFLYEVQRANEAAVR
jgi:hypothetical protein